MAAAVTSKSLIAAYDPTPDTWGTQVAPGALDLILPQSLGPLLPTSEMVPDPSAGYAWLQYIERCKENITPELPFSMRWTGRLYSLMAQIMGVDTPAFSTPNCVHVMTMLEAIDGLDNFGTLAAQLGPAGSELLFEWPSVKPTGFTIDGPDGSGYMNVTFRTIADTVNLGSDCTTATSDIDDLTHIPLASALPGIIPFGALRFRMTTNVYGAFDADDELKVRHFTFTFNRNMGPEWTARAAVANAWQTEEPIEDGIPECTLMIELGDLNNLTQLERYQDGTAMKCEAYWQYGTNNYFKIEIPKMLPVVPEASASGSSRIPQTLNYMIMQALANPTGMAFALPVITLADQSEPAYE